VHWVATATTPAGTSSLWYFLSKLQDKIFAPNCVDVLLICLMTMPLVPLAVPYFFFISSASAFFLVLSAKNNAGSIPRIGNPIICAIISTVMGMGLSSHMSPPCVTANSFLTHVFVYLPLPKCGRSSRPRILVFSSPVSHWYGWLISSPTLIVPVICINTLCASSENLASYSTSWSEYLSFLTWPSSSGPTYTPATMHGRNIYVASFLRGDLDIYILSFCCSGGWLKVLVAFGCSFVTHSDQDETYSPISPARCSEMVV
jgi:hypothetical protein